MIYLICWGSDTGLVILNCLVSEWCIRNGWMIIKDVSAGHSYAMICRCPSSVNRSLMLLTTMPSVSLLHTDICLCRTWPCFRLSPYWYMYLLFLLCHFPKWVWCLLKRSSHQAIRRKEEVREALFHSYIGEMIAVCNTTYWTSNVAFVSIIGWHQVSSWSHWEPTGKMSLISWGIMYQRFFYQIFLIPHLFIILSHTLVTKKIL